MQANQLFLHLNRQLALTQANSPTGAILPTTSRKRTEPTSYDAPAFLPACSLANRGSRERHVYGLALTAFSELDYTPRVEVVSLLDQVLIQYSTSECSWGEYGTFAKLRWHPADREVWFFKLHVARPFRRQGLGSRIVETCEKLATWLGSFRVSLMSLRGAKEFWKSLDYRPHPTMTRVLTKPLVRPSVRPHAGDRFPVTNEETYDHCCH